MPSAISSYLVNDHFVVHIVLVLKLPFFELLCDSCLKPQPTYFFSPFIILLSHFHSLPMSVCDCSGPLFYEMLNIEADNV